MTMSQIKIDPKAIQTNAAKASNVSQAKGQTVSTFDTMMGSVGAMGPFAGELSYGLSGDPTASSVISAAFNSFPAAASTLAGGGMAPVGYPSYARGGFAATQTDMQVPNLSGAFGSQTYQAGVAGGSQPIAGTGTSPYELMQAMNQNNLQLLELQAVMQSNMQTWTTKSNVLSADHRAKMSLIEKFTARG